MGQEAADRECGSSHRKSSRTSVCIPRRLASWPSPSSVARLNPPINLVFRTTEP